jgi:hypothetical protein
MKQIRSGTEAAPESLMSRAISHDSAAKILTAHRKTTDWTVIRAIVGERTLCSIATGSRAALPIFC